MTSNKPLISRHRHACILIYILTCLLSAQHCPNFKDTDLVCECHIITPDYLTFSPSSRKNINQPTLKHSDSTAPLRQVSPHEKDIASKVLPRKPCNSSCQNVLPSLAESVRSANLQASPPNELNLKHWLQLNSLCLNKPYWRF